MARMYKGTIQQVPSGSWCVWYYADDPATGKRKQKGKGGFPTRKAAEAFLTEVKSAQLHGLYTDVPKIGLKSLAEKFLTEYAPLHLAETTLRSHHSHMAHLVAYFGERPVGAIHSGDVQAFVATLARATSRRERGFSPLTVNHCLALLHRVFEVGKKWGFLRLNPAAGIEHLRVAKKEMAFHSREEVGKLLQAASGEAKTVLALGFLCGLRRAEVAGLRWKDVDFAKGQLHIRTSLFKRTKKEAAAKGGERWLLKAPKSEAGVRAVDMVPAVRDCLELHKLGAPPASKNPLGLVFTRPGLSAGGPVQPVDPEVLADGTYLRVVKAAGVRMLHFHVLRHTFTALRLASGVTDVKYLQRQLGHASIQVTLDTYGHLFSETNQQETAKLQAEVDKILAEAAAKTDAL